MDGAAFAEAGCLILTRASYLCHPFSHESLFLSRLTTRKNVFMAYICFHVFERLLLKVDAAAASPLSFCLSRHLFIFFNLHCTKRSTLMESQDSSLDYCNFFFSACLRYPISFIFSFSRIASLKTFSYYTLIALLSLAFGEGAVSFALAFILSFVPILSLSSFVVFTYSQSVVHRVQLRLRST